MRTVFLQILVITLLGLCAAVAAPQGKPIPPGVREADAQTNKPVEAPLSSKRRSVDPAQLKREADELAKLSASIPDQVALVAKGQLPKDLGDQLKRIEKLSKHIRSEVSQ